jgi:hypothetical protein
MQTVCFYNYISLGISTEEVVTHCNLQLKNGIETKRSNIKI